MRKLVTRPLDLSQEVDDVYGQPDRTAMVGDSSSDGLTNPPVHVSGESESALRIIFVNTAIKPQIAFLNQIQEGHPSTNVAACHTHNEAQIRLDESSSRGSAGGCLPFQIGTAGLIG
jgi:hypothetical protein